MLRLACYVLLLRLEAMILARKKEFESAAERQAAYRLRKLGVPSAVEKVEADLSAKLKTVGLIPPSLGGRSAHDKQRDDYAEALARVTSAQINLRRASQAEGLEPVSPDDVEARIKRAQSHARWLEQNRTPEFPDGMPYR